MYVIRASRVAVHCAERLEVGVAFDCQYDPEHGSIPTVEHDKRMDGILTPSFSVGL